jgi:hypothetical protein
MRQDVTVPGTASDRLWYRELTRITRNPSRAIYGTIVATAVTAASSSHGEPASLVAAAVAVTLVVFWIAHVYSAVLEDRYAGEPLSAAVVREAAVEELAMVEAGLVSIVILLFGASGLIANDLSVTLALASGVAQLVIWGMVTARRAGWSWAAAALASTVDGLLGLVIIALKSLLH